MAIQLGLLGRSRLFGELDALSTAVVTGALDARAQLDGRLQGDRDRDGRRRSRAQRRARALTGLCADSLGGEAATDPASDPPVEDEAQDPAQGQDHDDMEGEAWLGQEPARPGRHGSGRPARPLVVVHIPLDRITQTAAGLLEVTVPGWLPTLSARLTDALAADADIRAVIFDGARPLAVSTKLRARDIPADTRLAVTARDMGARDPAGRTPIGLSHIHHLDADRVHHPDRMAVISPTGHLRLIHRHGWTGQVNDHSGTITWTRHDRTTTTLPWHTTLRRGD